MFLMLDIYSLPAQPYNKGTSPPTGRSVYIHRKTQAWCFYSIINNFGIKMSFEQSKGNG